MISEKQLAANRENAKKSTGATSTTGKAASRLNALRDGITGQVTTLSDEDRPIFENLKAQHVADLAPQNFSELKLAHAIAWDTWRLDRLRATEMNILARGAEQAIEDAGAAAAENETVDPTLQTALAEAEVFEAQSARLELMSLYEQRLTRNLHRNRQALRELQAETRRNRAHDKCEEVLLARFKDLNDLPYQAPATPSPNGFVFSSDEITSEAARQRNLEALMYLLSTQAPWQKFGATGAGSPDLFAELPYRAPPDNLPKKIHGVSPESIALRKYYHPEEFEKRRR